ncbi:VOC family protein [Micromonospora craterilacus]|uniref:VOC family protein n=1 Tax=Micromonospora craterilacus TaxID=1655439 RepID=UPI001314BC96|nr:VOC family protein [Micromonospora craterilacus]
MAVGLLPAAASAARPTLTDKRVVMLFRRVDDLAATRQFVGELSNWPAIKVGPAGEDRNVVMYDAGGAVVGLATMAQQLSSNTCTVVEFVPTALVINPASVLALSADSANSARGATVSGADLVDDTGNHFAIVEPGADKDPALAAKREKIRSAARRAGVRSPLTEIRLKVADLKRSQVYYTELLGLRLLASTERTAHFDVGSLILTLETEANPGEVRRLSEAGRLVHDLLVFHVEALDDTMTALMERGVGFPRGVEKSDTGRIAYFDDPDGHVLCLWTPTGRATNFDFYPQIQRLLG